MAENGWKNPFKDELPLAGKIVELMLHGDRAVHRGKFLWNGFWLLNDGAMIGGGRVIGWRHIS